MLSIVVCTVPKIAAAGQSFTDVPSNHPAYGAVEYLKSMGMIGGYEDGTFRPDRIVNRAEALKLILAPLLPADGLKIYAHSAFDDVPDGSWYLPYVEAARTTLSIVEGPPGKPSFFPAHSVAKAEFLKMYFLAERVNVQGDYGELTAALSSDVPSDAWFFPSMRSALATSMVIVDKQGMLHPEAELTRGDIAQMLYRSLMYAQHRRTQSLLSEAEGEITNVVSMIDANSVEQASFAAARSTLAARGALTSDPNEPLVKAAVKTAEGFRDIVEAYRAGREKRYDDAIRLAGNAWNTASKVRELSPGLDQIATEMQTLAKKMADSARALKAQGT